MTNRFPILFSPAGWFDARKIRYLLRLDILVKYCGGCNCQIDRSKIIREIESLLPAGDLLTTDASGAPFDAGILACGCPTACARKPELAGLAKRWILIAGKTVDNRDLPDSELAGAVVKEIKK